MGEKGITQKGSNDIVPAGNPSLFFDVTRFEFAQRVAEVFARSTMVPEQFRGNIGNCVIALNLADRMMCDPFMLMQNMYIVHGKPGIEAKLAIALVNNTGKFTPIQYKYNDSKTSCFAFAKRIPSNELCEGVEVTLQMAKDEGWSTKSGSKWKTMPTLMLQYRSATFFARAYCPESLLGMRTREELQDVIDVNVTPKKRLSAEIPESLNQLQEFLDSKSMSPDTALAVEEFCLKSARAVNISMAELKSQASEDLDTFWNEFEKWFDKKAGQLPPKESEPLHAALSKPTPEDLEPSGNWWDSDRHWKFLKKDSIVQLVNLGLGAATTLEVSGYPFAAGTLKEASKETLKHVAIKYDKVAGRNGVFKEMLETGHIIPPEAAEETISENVDEDMQKAEKAIMDECLAKIKAFPEYVVTAARADIGVNVGAMPETIDGANRLIDACKKIEFKTEFNET